MPIVAIWRLVYHARPEMERFRMKKIIVSNFVEKNWGLEFRLEVGEQDAISVSSLDLESDPAVMIGRLIEYIELEIHNQDLIFLTETSVILGGFNCKKEYGLDELQDLSCAETFIESLHDLLCGL
ncbi:hypothetical protein EA58_14775 [Photobacterium galatheae]|uniref:Uncharacterized protein n=2 Tax=Photobacterium galatheae TaxID=1654360 RepID=A0A066RTH7_9GAMM|nr:hypothetical protein EA58_14775 [Photobacterium galatheae]